MKKTWSRELTGQVKKVLQLQNTSDVAFKHLEDSGITMQKSFPQKRWMNDTKSVL